MGTNIRLKIIPIVPSLLKSNSLLPNRRATMASKFISKYLFASFPKILFISAFKFMIKTMPIRPTLILVKSTK